MKILSVHFDNEFNLKWWNPISFATEQAYSSFPNNTNVTIKG